MSKKCHPANRRMTKMALVCDASERSDDDFDSYLDGRMFPKPIIA